MSGLPFDAASALWQRTAAGDPGQEAPVLPPVGAPGPQLFPEGPGDRAAGDAMRGAVNSGIVNPLLGIWQDFKSGLPVAGAFVFLALLFVVGLVMVFLGARGGESFVREQGGAKNAGV